MDKKELFTRRLHFPKFKKKSKKTGKYSEVIATLNNISEWYRYKKTDIKNNYQSMLKEYYIPEPETTYDYLTLQYRIIRHTRQRLDQDNAIFAIKFILDVLETEGYIKDDKNISIQSFETIHDLDSPETMIEIRLLNDKQTWQGTN